MLDANETTCRDREIGIKVWMRLKSAHRIQNAAKMGRSMLDDSVWQRAVRRGVVDQVELPPFLPSESLVQESQYFGHVELNVLQVEIVLAILLHF